MDEIAKLKDALLDIKRLAHRINNEADQDIYALAQLIEDRAIEVLNKE